MWVPSRAVGLVAELYRPAVQAMVADIVPEAQRLRAYGLLYWAVNLGFSLSPLIAGFVARQSYLALFVADAVTTFVFAAIILWRVPETLPAASRQPPKGGRRRGLVSETET